MDRSDQWETEIVRSLQKGVDTEEGFRLLFKRYYRPVTTIFRERGFSPEESQDLAQSVFLRVFRSIDTFRPELPFKTWIYQIALNVASNERRARYAEKRKGAEEPLEPSGEDGSTKHMELATSQPSALDMMAYRERRDRLYAALSELPIQMRKVCELRFVQDRKYQEIADLMGISIETVKAHLHQARKRLTAKLGE